MATRILCDCCGADISPPARRLNVTMQAAGDPYQNHRLELDLCNERCLVELLRRSASTKVRASL